IIGAHNKWVGAFASNQNYMAAARLRKRAANGFPSVQNNFRSMIFYARSYFRQNLFRIFIVWVFVGQNYFVAKFVGNFSHRWSFPFIATAAGIAENTNLFFVRECLINGAKRIGCM